MIDFQLPCVPLLENAEKFVVFSLAILTFRDFFCLFVVLIFSLKTCMLKKKYVIFNGLRHAVTGKN